MAAASPVDDVRVRHVRIRGAGCAADEEGALPEMVKPMMLLDRFLDLLTPARKPPAGRYNEQHFVRLLGSWRNLADSHYFTRNTSFIHML